jgi:hypothetical protein
MTLIETIKKIHNAENEGDIFDGLCCIQNFLEHNDRKGFFEEKISKKGEKFFVLKNDYTIGIFCKIFDNPTFLKCILGILKYQKEYKELESVPEKILRQGYFVNLSLNSCFYFISLFSKDLKQKNIEFFGRSFWLEIKKLEEKFSYEFTKIDILNAFERIIFDQQYFFKKEFSIKINAESFYHNFQKSRLIIGNYLTDFSIPILLSNTFKKLTSAKKESGGTISAKHCKNVLIATLRKYEFLSNGFKFDSLKDKKNECTSFDYFFSVRESRKILFLIYSVIEDLDMFDENEIINKINNSEDQLGKVRDFFYRNYNIFPDYRGPKTEGQWGNKSFLNTIKFFSIISTIKNSHDARWKIDNFLKHFGDWMDDLNDNINYFSELDDFNIINDLLKSGEDNEVEFKATFGLPIQGYAHESELKGIKRDILNKIAETILAMANSNGGNIFIGVIEKPDKIKLNNEITSQIVTREGLSFLDIHFSLNKEGEDFDGKRLTLQQILKNLTTERLDFLDSLFSFRFYKIYIENKKSHIEILDIKVEKANKPIFLEKDNWITLPKRLNGRVEKVNPVKELIK